VRRSGVNSERGRAINARAAAGAAYAQAVERERATEYNAWSFRQRARTWLARGRS